MTPGSSIPAEPDRAASDDADGDVLISERAARGRRLPNQHDLDVDDLEDAVLPYGGTPDDDHPSASSA